MRTHIFRIGALLVCMVGAWLFMRSKSTLEIHPLSGDSIGEHESVDEREKAAYVALRLQYEEDILKDAKTGLIPANIRTLELAQAMQIGERDGMGLQTSLQNTYNAAGPLNIGGRTRALALDIRFGTGGNSVILAGSVSGGLQRSADGGLSWTRVSPPDYSFSITALVQDPRPGFQNTWYAGGGEPVGNSASGIGAQYLGDALLKSVDNGLTWTKLTNQFFDQNGTLITTNGGNPFTLEAFDNPFDIIHKLLINPQNGHLYVAGHRRLLRSTDAGATFRIVFTSTTASTGDQGQMDLVCTQNGRFYLGVNGGLPDRNLRGIWTSTSGDLNSWTRFAGGQTINVDSIPNWRGNTSGSDPRRIVLALAPSNQNRLFAMYENGLSQEAARDVKPEIDLFRFDLSNNTVLNLSANMPDVNGQLDGVDPFTTQGGYNMSIAIKPDNENVILLGGTCLYRSTDGFTSTTNTRIIGGYGPNVSPLRIYTNSHPDMHALLFDPSNSNRVFVGDDGGIQTTSDILANNTNPQNEPVTWTMINNYQTLQYYHVGISPTAGQENYIGGAQDNGTYVRIGGGANPNSHFKVLGGDGGVASIASISGANFTFYCSIQQGTLYKDVTNQFTIITPAGLTANPAGGFGDFVTYFKMDFDNPEQLYYVNFNRVFRTRNASSVTPSTWEELVGVGQTIPANYPITNGTARNTIRSLETTRGTYNVNSVLYIGTAQGKLYRLNDPAQVTASTAPVEIGPALPAGSNIADIAVNPNNDSEVMFVVSNYNNTNIWWTDNAKSATPTWRNAEGNLTLPSIRSCMIVTKRNESNQPITEYYVGSSVGLYAAEGIGSTLQGNGSVNWLREGSNLLGLAVVVSLDYRPQDNTMVIGTHGNGMYLTKTGTPNFTGNSGGGGGGGGGGTDPFFVSVAGTLTRNYVDIIKGNTPGVSRMEVRLFDAAGKMIMRSSFNYANRRIDLSALPAGVYIIQVFAVDQSESFTTRIVKQ
jgi:hypothetical protein